jgi:hypothetical protein
MNYDMRIIYPMCWMGGLMYFEALAILLSKASDEQKKLVYSAIILDMEDLGLRIIPFISDFFDQYFSYGVTGSDENLHTLKDNVRQFALISILNIAKVISGIYEIVVKLVPYHRRKLDDNAIKYLRKAAALYDVFSDYKRGSQSVAPPGTTQLGKYNGKVVAVEDLPKLKYFHKNAHVLDDPDIV